jgi:hypothetical protein
MIDISNTKLGERPMQTIDELCDSIGKAVDVSKIRVGDEVTVRAKVLRTDAGIQWPIQIATAGVCLCVGPDTIATHTPTPREFKPGDRVTWASGVYNFEFVAAREGWAALWGGKLGWDHRPINDLRHADESE